MSERARDPIWDALTEAFGPARTKNENGRRNAATRQLREANATPEEIAIAASYCERNFRNYTEMAVCSWLSAALKEHSESAETRRSFMRLLNPTGEVR